MKKLDTETDDSLSESKHTPDGEAVLDPNHLARISSKIFRFNTAEPEDCPEDSNISRFFGKAIFAKDSRLRVTVCGKKG